jgi:hypothetical protein
MLWLTAIVWKSRDFSRVKLQIEIGEFPFIRSTKEKNKQLEEEKKKLERDSKHQKKGK